LQFKNKAPIKLRRLLANRTKALSKNINKPASEKIAAYAFKSVSEQLQFKPNTTPGDRYQGTIKYFIFIEISYASHGQNHPGNTFN